MNHRFLWRENGCKNRFFDYFDALITMRSAIVIAIIMAGFILSGPADAQPVIPGEHNYAINSPGVAMVQTVFSATVYVNKVEINQRRFNLLVDSVKRLDTSGSMLSAERKLDIVVKALYNNPLRFFAATNSYLSQQHRILSNGTGFFITGDGYFITNCHIIDRDSAFIRQKFILSTFREVADGNIRSLESSWEVVLTEEQKNLLYNSYSLIYSQLSSMILFDLNKEIYVIYRADNADNMPFKVKKPARVIVKGKAMPGKDVAILKLDNVKDLPTLPISKDSIIDIGEKILVYGYPEPVGNNVFLAAESNTEPTLTAGVVSAIKQSIGRWPVIQMDAMISHGSSGSPVCDDKGEVIGLATFGSLEQNTGGLASGYNFAIPVSVIKEFLTEAKVTPQLSQTSLLYNEGLRFFYQSFYNKALKRFEDVRKINSNYPGLNHYVRLCTQRMEAGEDRASFLQKNFFRVISVILIFGGIYVYYRWKRGW